MYELAPVVWRQCVQDFVPLLARESQKPQDVLGLLCEVGALSKDPFQRRHGVVTTEHPDAAGIED
jgi:hypothetical protein